MRVTMKTNFFISIIVKVKLINSRDLRIENQNWIRLQYFQTMNRLRCCFCHHYILNCEKNCRFRNWTMSFLCCFPMKILQGRFQNCRNLN